LEVLNDIGGLLTYFTAPNIRHKVKHPIFLAIKFSNCLDLFYNSDYIRGNDVFLIFLKFRMKSL
jgi:hypothetical protein